LDGVPQQITCHKDIREIGKQQFQVFFNDHNPLKLRCIICDWVAITVGVDGIGLGEPQHSFNLKCAMP
jgi:hypothetical protein